MATKLKSYITRGSTSADLMESMRQMYRSKYYNLYMNMFKWNGLTSEEQDYVMRKFWDIGTLAAFKIKGTEAQDGSGGIVGFCPWTTQTWNMYDFPEKVNFVNERGVPFIPGTTQVVNVDTALGWIQRCKKPVRSIVDYYIDRMVQVDMVVNTNVELHKMPFLVGVSPEDKDKMDDIVSKILNDEIVVYADLESLSMVKSLSTSPSYIVDKLHAYRVQLENELLSYLGVDNQGNTEKATTMLVDEINSNNVLINMSQQNFVDCLNEWLDKIKELFGKEISIEPTAKPAEPTDSSETKSKAEGGGQEMARGQTNE